MHFSAGLQARARSVVHADACVVVIDDDAPCRESLGQLFRSVDLHPLLFASAADFVVADAPDVPTCLVLEVRLPGRSGLDLQADFVAAGVGLSMVFVTAHGDIPMAVRAMRAGAIDFLTKPFRDQDLLDAVHTGLARDRARRERAQSQRALRLRFDALTPRERAIFAHVVAGKLNKQIAGELGITETTVKVHRSNMMRKLHAPSLAELCRMAEGLERSVDSGGPHSA